MKAALLNRLTLYRDLYHEKGTTGFFKTPEGIDICRSLELAWNNNLRDDKKTKIKESSCIPEGRYRCTKFLSPHSKTEVILLHGVPGRSMCEIHAGNVVDEVDGCIMPGQKIEKNYFYKGKNHDFFITDSAVGLKKLLDLTEKEFWLTVISAETLCRIDSKKGRI